MASENKIRRIAVWVVSVPLTVVFLIAGVMKLLGKAAGMFEHWGYPAWFSYAVGAVEVVSSRSAPDSEGRIPRRCCIGSGHGRSHFHPYPGQRMEPRPRGRGSTAPGCHHRLRPPRAIARSILWRRERSEATAMSARGDQKLERQIRHRRGACQHG